MLSSSIESSTPTLESASRMLGKGEDFVMTGKGIQVDTETPFSFILVMDGHGGDSCINIIRSAPEEHIVHIVSQIDPVFAMTEFIRVHHSSYHFRSGATFSLVKMDAQFIRCYNVGDSKSAVFLDSQLTYLTRGHTIDDPNERSRLDALFGHRYTVNKSHTIQVYSPTAIHMKPNSYILTPKKLNLAMTQSMGHHDELGYNPEVCEIQFLPNQRVDFIVGSDGLWDMINLDLSADALVFHTGTAEEIVDYAAGRWKQEWIQVNSKGATFVGHEAPLRLPEFDDICVGVLRVREPDGSLTNPP